MTKNKEQLRTEFENVLQDVAGYDQNINVEEGMKRIDKLLAQNTLETLNNVDSTIKKNYVKITGPIIEPILSESTWDNILEQKKSKLKE